MRVLIIQGHPDSSGSHLCHALAEVYGQGARIAGHSVRELDVARLGLPLLRSKQDWESGAPPEGVRASQEAIEWAEHLVIVYPLWLGDVPAVLKGFFEQVLRPGFARMPGASGGFGAQRLRGKSARIVVTMGMPASVYRWFYRSHGLRSLRRNILAFCGIAPVRSTLIGMVEAGGIGRGRRLLRRMRRLGAKAR